MAILLSATMLLTAGQVTAGEKFTVPYEKYTLGNGLDVILHVDRSDPVVAVAIQYHVGSNREKPGKTGFAHLFEHMMFQESENVPQDQFFHKIQNAGGTLNGGTNKDGTVYYEVVPKNAVEMVLWMEADRMGYLTNTVTREAFANQQNVVQNEKRQNYDNRPYGHSGYVMDKNFYPAGHPYSWQVIGEMQDLFNATVEDVKEFHAAYYVPNNATLVIAGDFDPAMIRKMVGKYFGEIPGGEKVVDLQPMPVTLPGTKKLFHEDNFATTPQLTMAWPVPEQYTKDSYALTFLGQILSSGKKAPLYKILVKEKQLTSRVRAYNQAQELGGRFQVTVNANSNVSLADVEKAIFRGFELFEKEGISESDLERIKASQETSFYNDISSVLSKSFMLARYNEYAGDPGFITEDLANIRAVNVDDVMRVYEKYIKNRPYVATSFVPKGDVSLVAEGSVRADVVEERITEAVEVKINSSGVKEEIIRTPSSFDRSVEPPAGPDPQVTLPSVYSGKLKNGITVTGIKNDELPLVTYSLRLEGGHLLDPRGKEGVASFVASMLTEGTKNLTPEELEERIDLLGARISVNAGTEEITINVNTLARNFEKSFALVEEIILEPRWDEEQFKIVKNRMLNNLKRNAANPNYLADAAFMKLVYGEGHILASDIGGTAESVSSITPDDLKEYYKNTFSPSVASLNVVGDIDLNRVQKAARNIVSRWTPFRVDIPAITPPQKPEKSKIYFVDIPGAKQSVIQIGGPAMPRTDPGFFPATVVNHKLGGSFNGILNLILREEKGFTYGARSAFSGGINYGEFTASSSVRSSATLESVCIFKEEIEKYTGKISEEDLQFTKNALTRSNARNFETLPAKLEMLNEITKYKKPVDYIRSEENFIRSLTPESHVKLAQQYIQHDHFYYVVAGDAETQLKALEKAGLGTPVLIK